MVKFVNEKPSGNIRDARSGYAQLYQLHNGNKMNKTRPNQNFQRAIDILHGKVGYVAPLPNVTLPHVASSSDGSVPTPPVKRLSERR